ncbi:MAG: hypothetical protein IJ555_03110 [Ruminococcus sp.]|nr:hypothetical protein [Ruminococcus sp.]
MYKSITIGEKNIQLKGSIFSQLIYKQAFGIDMLVQLNKVRKQQLKLKEIASEKSNEDNNDRDDEELAEMMELSFKVKLEYYKFLWAFAKGADRTLPAFEDWISELEPVAFPDVADVVNETVSAMIRIDRKNA